MSRDYEEPTYPGYDADYWYLVDPDNFAPLVVWTCDGCGGVVADRAVHDRVCPGKDR